MRNFREFDVWKNGMAIVLEIYNITKILPAEERFNLVSQMQRSAISIPSNIAEGSGRNSEKDFKRFLEIAQGSAFELETQVELCARLNYVEQEDISRILELIHKEEKMINKFVSTIKRSLH